MRATLHVVQTEVVRALERQARVPRASMIPSFCFRPVVRENSAFRFTRPDRNG
jgi:hypothetical protein